MTRTSLIILTGIALILASVGVWFFFFRNAPAAVEPTPIFSSTEPSADKKVSDHAQLYDIDAKYPAETPLPVSSGAQKTMEAFVIQETQAFKKENISTLTPEDIEVMHLGGDRKYALDIEYQTYASAKTVSYVFTIYLDTMGAHPNTTFRTFTFDRATGAELTLGDLFTRNTSYLETLSTRARPILTATIAKASNASESEIDTTSIKSGTEPRKENFAWFYIQDTSLVLLFPPYQVGPYAIGTQSVTLELSSLADFKSEYK